MILRVVFQSIHFQDFSGAFAVDYQGEAKWLVGQWLVEVPLTGMILQKDDQGQSTGGFPHGFLGTPMTNKALRRAYLPSLFPLVRPKMKALVLMAGPEP